MSTLSIIYQNGESKIVLNGVEHWYKIGGVEHKTTPLVVIHGGPSGNQLMLERTIGKKLEQWSTVILYEQRGCGRSGWPLDPNEYSMSVLVDDLEQLRTALDVSKINLLGTSFGGEIALEYSLAYPENVKNLILQGPAVGNWERLRLTQYIGYQNIAEGQIKDSIEAAIISDKSLDERISKIHQIIDPITTIKFSLYNSDLHAEALENWRELTQFPFNDSFHRKITERPKEFPTLLDRISKIQIPTTVIVGLHDRHTGVEMSRDVISRIKNSELVILNNSAHYPEVDELETYHNVIKEKLLIKK